jgi:hypothetical protein
MDLDGDARISSKEFLDSIQPMESYTKESLSRMKATNPGLLAPVASGQTFDSKRE